IALELHTHQILPGALDQLLRVAAGIFIVAAAIFGTLLATYTGVLIGASAIPAWFLHRTLLPIHFGTAGLGSAAALLELIGHRIAPLHAIGFFPFAAISFLIGSLVSRIGWIAVGKVSGADPESVFAAEQYVLNHEND